jgi:peroxiredoxin
MADRRILVPIIAAIVLTIVCVWRLATNKPQDYADQVAAAIVMRPAPPIEGRDSDNHLVRLATFLGRHKIIVLFFNGEAGVDGNPATAGGDNDPELMRLRDRYPELQSHNVKVVAVSTALPQHNRAAMDRVGKFPFPLVTDIDPLDPANALRIHRQWGRIDPRTEKPRTGVFLVDRRGQVTFTVDGPRPMENVDAAVDAAIK